MSQSQHDDAEMTDADAAEYYYSDDEGEERASAPGGGAGRQTSEQGSPSRAPPRTSLGSGLPQDYAPVSPQQVEALQAAVISDVASVLAVSPSVAHLLLAAHKWDKGVLLEKFMSDPEGVQARVGVRHAGGEGPATAPFSCDICLEDKSAAEGFHLGCGHTFCVGCWGGYLGALAESAGSAAGGARCPDGACGEAAPPAIVARLTTPDIAAKLKRFDLQSYVHQAKSLAWCPGAGCTSVYSAPRASSAASAIEVSCGSCGSRFCFRCKAEAHTPLSCAMMALWADKCTSEAGNASWILAHTKKCPKCSVRIEKNQGCNHMTCRAKTCSFEFCWVCLGPWADHGTNYFNCTKYQAAGAGGAGGAGGAMSEAARAKAELDRYLFYFQRYDNHAKSAAFAAKHRETATRRMAELMESSGASAAGMTYADSGFLTDATEALLECRRVLKYTYALGYFMADGAPERPLFENLQERLEMSTDRLAELTETPVDKLTMELRAEVVNFTRVTLQFLRNLVAGIEEGLTGAA